MMLYTKYRPKKLSKVIGQPSAVATLSDFLVKKNVPRAVMLVGPPGVGKTTLARIVASEMGCSNVDLTEVACATCEPLDTIRDVKRNMNLCAMGAGKIRAWIFDEAQSLSRGTFAQQGLLPILEDDHVAPHAHFFLCTTEPDKINKAVRSRCTTIALNAIDPGELKKLVSRVCKGEKRTPTEEVKQRVVEISDGSARTALVLLEKVLTRDTQEEQLALLETESPKALGIELCRLLVKKGVRWPEVAKVLNDLKNEDPEKLRRSVLGYAQAILLKGISPRAFTVISNFRDPVYDSGFPAIVANAYETVCSK